MTSDGQLNDELVVSAARDVLLDFLARREGGDTPDFEAVCRARPELESELRRQLATFDRAPTLLKPDSAELSLGERLRRHFGAELSPRVSLDKDAAFGDRAANDVERGRYRVVGEIGRGGMGAIFKVWDADLRRNLAVKVALSSDQRAPASRVTASVDKKDLARFLEEAQITSQLDHPGIVPVHDLGLDGEGRLYFTMRLVRGRDLKDVFELARHGEEGFTQKRVVGVLVKVCEALAFAHAKGVIHRDLKPSNVMVGRFGEVYVMDWGVARVLGAPDSHDLRMQAVHGSVSAIRSARHDEAVLDPDSSLVTLDGDVVGTPAYMSPEQARGEIEQLSPRSDVYSVGAMLYQLLAGQAPFVPRGARASPVAIRLRLLDGPPRPLLEIDPKLPRELVAICDKAMAREANARYASMLELGADLQAYVEGHVVHAYETGVMAEVRKWGWRNKALAITALSLLLVLVGAVVYKSGRDRRERNDAVARAQQLEQETKTAESAISFLRGMCDDVDPTNGGRANVTVEQVLEAQALKLDEQFADQPAVASRVSGTIGWVFFKLDQRARAKPLLEQALRLASTAFAADSEQVRQARQQLTSFYQQTQEWPRAIELCGEQVASLARTEGADGAKTLAARKQLATLHRDSGDVPRAMSDMRQLIAIAEHKFGALAPETLAARRQLADFMLSAQDFDAARRELDDLLTVVRRAAPIDQLVEAEVLNERGLCESYAKQHAASVEYFARAFERRNRVLGTDDELTRITLGNLAAQRTLVGDHAHSEQDYSMLAASCARKFGVASEKYRDALAQVLAAQLRQISAPELEPELAALKKWRLDLVKPSEANVLELLERLVNAYASSSNWIAAVPRAKELVEHTPRAESARAQREALLSAALEHDPTTKH